MVYSSFDVRNSIRQLLGILRLNEDDKEEYSIPVEHVDYSDSYIYVAIYFSEEINSDTLPSMPFIELEPLMSIYEPHDIAAATRKMEGWVTLHLYFTNIDGIIPINFAKTIKDYIQNKIRNNQCSVSGIDFMNIEEERFERETDGHQEVFHYIITLYCVYYDI